MKIRQHLYLFYLATTFWTFFFLAGLWSHYFQTLTFLTNLVFIDILPTILLGFLSISLIKDVGKNSPMRTALWIAFYFTVPFFAYDLIYLGLHKNLGLNFIWSHWYLTLFYVIPWIVVPLSAKFFVKT